jgi:hypothetical protein
MTTIAKLNRPSRRALLKSGGALVVSIGAPMPLNLARAAEEARLVGAQPPLTPDQLSSYIAVNADGTISAFTGKMDMGQGLSVALRQIVAEELDVPYSAVKLVIGDTTAVSIRAALPARPASSLAASSCAWQPPKRGLCFSI